ncbi:hypothetical protein FRX31_019325, partial [Thalictrum thalictroides]
MRRYLQLKVNEILDSQGIKDLDTLKLNCDGAVTISKGSGYGGLLRDCAGDVMYAYMGQIDRDVSRFFKNSEHCITPAAISINTEPSIWIPPSQGNSKINVDISYYDAATPITIGYIIRSFNGTYVYEGTESACACSAEEAEAKGILVAVKVGTRYQLRILEVETD